MLRVWDASGVSWCVSVPAFAASTQMKLMYSLLSRSVIFFDFSIHGFQMTVDLLPVFEMRMVLFHWGSWMIVVLVLLV